MKSSTGFVADRNRLLILLAIAVSHSAAEFAGGYFADTRSMKFRMLWNSRSPGNHVGHHVPKAGKTSGKEHKQSDVFQKMPLVES
jgi:hypothetical protein